MSLHESPHVVTPRQLGRLLDFAEKGAQPAYVFLYGASGSGKSTLAENLVCQVNRPGAVVARFDDSPRWGMNRWEEHVHEFPSVESCQKQYVSDWFGKVSSEFRTLQLVICDVNTQPDFIELAALKHNIRNFRIVLVQPSEDIRWSRLASDETRSFLDIATLRDQMGSEFAEFLESEARRRSDVHIVNETLTESLHQLSRVCAGLLQNET